MTPDRQRVNRPVVFCWSIALAGAVVLFAAIGLLAPRMAPVRPGSSALFWRYACGVGLTPETADRTWSGRAYFVDDAWAAYDQSHYHGSDIYYVPVAEVLADFDAVVARLQQAAEQGRGTPFAGGYVNWRDDEGRACFGGVLRTTTASVVDAEKSSARTAGGMCLPHRRGLHRETGSLQTNRRQAAGA